MIIQELAPIRGAPRRDVGFLPTQLWLDSQHLTEAARLHLVSARRRHQCCSTASAPYGRNVRQQSNSPERFPPPRSPRSNRKQPTSIPSPKTKSTIDPAAQRLVDELGALGWRCKNAPPPRWPPDTLVSARDLLASLLTHISNLPAGNLAHCCWALAQLGEAGGHDPAVVGFVAAVQRELLSPSAAAGMRTSLSYPGAKADVEEPSAPGAEEGVEQLVAAVGSSDSGSSSSSSGTLGRREATPTPRLAAVPHIQSRLTEMDPKDLSKLAWAVAKLGLRPDDRAPPRDGRRVAPEAAAAAKATDTSAAVIGDTFTAGTGGRPPPDGAAAAADSPSGQAGPGVTRASAGVGPPADWRELQLHWWRELGQVAADAVRRVQMPPQALCNTLWAFATAGQCHRPLLRAAAECITRGYRSRYEPVGVSNLFWAFSTSGFFAAPAPDPELRSPGGDLSGGGSAAAAAVADMYGDEYDMLYGTLIRLAEPMVAAMTLQHLANVAWALVTTRQHVRQSEARRLLTAICARATEVVAAAAASASSAAAAVPLPGERPSWRPPPPSPSAGLYGEMLALAAQDEQLGAAAAVGGTIIGRPPNHADMARYEPRSASLLAWSLAQAAPPRSPRCVSYLQAAAAAALAVPPGLSSHSDQDMAMLLMAHFRCRHYSPDLVRAVRQEILRRLEREMDPQALTNICYCLAMSNYYSEELYEAVAAAAAPLLERFGPPLATRLLWSFARARHYSPKLLAAFSAYIRPRLSECGAEDLVASASALAHFHHYDATLFQALAAEILRRIATPPAPPALPPPEQQPRQQRQRQGKRPPQQQQQPGLLLPPRALVNLLWCFTVLSHVDEGLLGALLQRLKGVDIRRLAVPAVMQLCQAQVMLKDLYGGVIKPPEVLTAPQMEVARATWQRVSAGATTISRLQRDVVACLRRLGTQPRCERVTLDGLFSIDTSLEWCGRRVAVEVDGPSHFTCSRPFRPLGRTLAKRRCLEMRGWRVLSVPGHEWVALGGDPDTEDRYMRAALDGVLWRTHVLEGLS